MKKLDKNIIIITIKKLITYNIDITKYLYTDRFIVINKKTGSIINDAFGYGFKTIYDAYKSTYYNLNKKK